ncbi:hypothetical protein Tsubulata_023539 [Turnera subulata]|uniref:FBD domain-containing protein n=1 Tax=Turnera subulata TaxID=218843 RepID=A0A9Q0F1Q9_9ROSI|nr:hypothetical protein Tsubulata_023539 [Turnera subulata]
MSSVLRFALSRHVDHLVFNLIDHRKWYTGLPQSPFTGCSSLKSLLLGGCTTLPSQAEVHALEECTSEESKVIYEGRRVESLFKLLQGLGNAESVTLSSTSIQAVLRFPENLENQPSPFSRLKHLVVSASSHEGKASGYLEIPDKVMNYLLGGCTNVSLTFTL